LYCVVMCHVVVDLALRMLLTQRRLGPHVCCCLIAHASNVPSWSPVARDASINQHSIANLGCWMFAAASFCTSTCNCTCKPPAHPSCTAPNIQCYLHTRPGRLRRASSCMRCGHLHTPPAHQVTPCERGVPLKKAQGSVSPTLPIRRLHTA
jgi:hypothetical protein